MVEIKKILFPVDLTKNSRRVVPYVRHFAEKFGASVYLIHVVRGPEEFSGFEMGATWFSSFEAEVRKGAESAIEKFIEEEMAGVAPKEVTVAMGDVAEEITKYAGKIGADMIVMGTHGRKGLENIMFGSVARGVLKDATCPVLTVNPHRATA